VSVSVNICFVFISGVSVSISVKEYKNKYSTTTQFHSFPLRISLMLGVAVQSFGVRRRRRQVDVSRITPTPRADIFAESEC
jgi:hypothetical protein